MPDQFIKFPRVESIQYFESAMYGHNKVLRCKKISDSYYEIQREDLPPIFVFVSNYYALSVSDYYEITSEYQIDCLVTISNWNRGTVYPSSLKNNTGDFVDIKAFIEIAYKHWIINTGECHYKFTIEVNDRFKIFKLPYRLQNGIVIKQGYKSTSPIDKIINYRMFERKIQFSEEMINSKDIMEKKSALDFIIDALQYLISTKGDTRNEQYKALALSVSDNMDGKVYAVVKKELDELMKLSNEYFDVRHNDYLNAAKEKREPLNDSQFIEYLYNRAYSILYLLRLKS